MSDDFKLSFDTIRELRIHNAVMVLTDRDDGGVEIDVYPVPADAQEGMAREGEDAVLARATSQRVKCYSRVDYLGNVSCYKVDCSKKCKKKKKSLPDGRRAVTCSCE